MRNLFKESATRRQIMLIVIALILVIVLAYFLKFLSGDE
jgi:glucose uptake protein GlcU